MRSAHQQFAIENGGKRKHIEQFGEGCGYIVARAGEQFRFVPRPYQLHADTVPFPFRRIIRQIHHRFFERVGQHEGAEGRQVGHVGRRFAVGGPVEQFGVGRGETVPIFLHLVDRDVESLRKGGLGQTAGYADPHTPGGELEQGVAAGCVEPVEQPGQFGHDGLAVHRFEQFDRFGHPRGRGGMFGRGPQQAGRFRGIAHEIAAQRP